MPKSFSQFRCAQKSKITQLSILMINTCRVTYFVLRVQKRFCLLNCGIHANPCGAFRCGNLFFLDSASQQPCSHFVNCLCRWREGFCNLLLGPVLSVIWTCRIGDIHEEIMALFQVALSKTNWQRNDRFSIHFWTSCYPGRVPMVASFMDSPGAGRWGSVCQRKDGNDGGERK